MLTAKELSTVIARVGKTGEVLNKRIQTALVNIAGHAYEHGNVTSARDLLNACKGADKVAIVKYLRAFCFVNVAHDGSVSLNKKARAEADFVDGDAVISYLNHQPRWDESAISTETAAKIVDPIKSLEALINKIAKADNVKYVFECDLQNAVDKLADALAISNRKAKDAKLSESLAANDDDEELATLLQEAV